MCVYLLGDFNNWSLKFIQVRGTPASGKTTLLNLLWTYIKAKEPNGVNIHLFVRWNRDGVDNVDDSTWLRQKIPGFPNPTAKTYLLFDNGECTYWDAALWDYFFKRHRDFDKYRIILFCSYGSAGSQPLRYNPGTPMNLESVAQVSLVCDDMSVDNFGKIKLLLSPNEFDEIIERRQVEFAVAPGLQKMIFSWTGGHVGAVTDVLNIIFREASYFEFIRHSSLDLFFLVRYEHGRMNLNFRASHWTSRSFQNSSPSKVFGRCLLNLQHGHVACQGTSFRSLKWLKYSRIC